LTDLIQGEYLMTALADRELNPPRTKQDPLAGEALDRIFQELGNDWQLIQGSKLEKQYTFRNFREALDFTVKVGELAEQVDHHPEICLTWGKASISIWTHSIGGLSEADFVFAARCDKFVPA
jgi:4a-hydroxytetrahydrobiopterin dehydratase